MKNLHFLALLWLFPFLSNGQQIIDVNSNTDAKSSYAPEKLVKEVLIASACSDISNFTSQVNGVPSATATKSYGYFKKPTGSSFPFDKGIILTTGIAKVAGSPTTIGVISSNTNNLPGDTDLENALGVSATADATYFKFYFTPQVNEISFRYIMASEEYDGMTECTYADSFAFLLREVGTPNYTNLAVLPDGTPVSVTNINNSTICRRNPQYFDEYDPNTTNYGGHTKVLTAKSGVTIGATYEIKLVVADQGDSAFDSAIFLEAGSFNIGGDLGPDQTIANGNPGCVGTPITLDAQLNNTGLTFTWYKDGVVIPGAYNSTLDVTTDGTYKFTASSGTGGCTATDEVVVEFAIPPIIDQNPEDILMCDTDDDLVVQFDFTANEALVLGSQTAANFIITYQTQANAEHNQSPLPIPYSNTQQHQTIWLRIADTTQNCYKVISFDIEVQKRAVANTLSDYELCDDATDGDDTNGIATFDLTTKNQELLGTQPSTNFKITYYNTQAEADAGTESEVINDPKVVILQGEINPIYDPTKAGNYTVVVTNKTTLCRISASTVVIESFPPESIATTILHPAFTSPNEVQVDVKGRGDYEYALDEGPWQKNKILKNVHYGMHTIYVRDRYGCAIEKVKINIIDYPKYFTPNGDGYHDTWNISSLRHQANAKIYIFDRYGKLLKEIRPAGEGWNGTFNGQPMPTTDYWFIVEYYTEASNIMKQFKVHFTLKR